MTATKSPTKSKAVGKKAAPKSKPVPFSRPLTPRAEIHALLAGKKDPQIELVVIDGQWDFCSPKGALSVAGADKDMDRLAALIYRLQGQLGDIHLTFDSHHPLHIAHPEWWINAKKEHPKPFTIITVDDITNGVWRTASPGAQKRSAEYVKRLAANKRYPLCIWPPHCLIGSDGFKLMPVLFEAVTKWERDNLCVADLVTKGSNPYTEHYSAIQADVPDSADPSTQLNISFIQTVEKADIILLSGEAGSHCLAHTVRDLATAFTSRSRSTVGKFVLLTDATSPVGGFEPLQEKFIDDMVAQGMKLSSTTDFLA